MGERILSGIKNIKLDDYEAYLGITDPLPWITGKKTVQSFGNIRVICVLDRVGTPVSLDTVLEYIS